MSKKAFTLFELIIVIGLVSIIYYMTLSNFSLKQQKLDSVTLLNLKQNLLKFEFEDTISLKCVDDKDVECFVLIDNEIQDEKITNLFKTCPEVYEYSKEQKRIEFDDLELENLESYKICFEFKIDKYKNSSKFIVDTSDGVFIYDNISKQPKKIKYINDIDLYFDDKISEVKDAF
ncbi:MAG: type II secretion system protein [Campylobacterota bacterium]|nr:type II secretion system protein [Campylobacterota bacterium]